MGFFSKIFKKEVKPKKITLGLALGSGGAKGFAELGALYAFEENGIQFDVIAGASIGSVVGAFYANGYSATDITELLKGINFGEITNLTMMGMDTAGMKKVVDNSIGNLRIEELKKPFRAVATDFESGEEHMFSAGNVADALCASSAYPPFFKPVEIEGKKYIDGAFTNSIPADYVKDLGADYIVGIDLSNHETKSGLLSKVLPSYKGALKEPWEKGYKYSDTMLHPDLSAYKPIYFWLGNEMFDIGYNCAIEAMPKILSDIEKLKFPHKK